MWSNQFWMSGMWVFPLLFLIFVFFMVFVRCGYRPGWYQNRKDLSGGQPESALDILKKRYANGEIDSKEFDKMKKDLR